MPGETPQIFESNPIGNRCFINVYGNEEKELHWFPMRIAYDKDVLKIGEILKERRIEFFLPTDEEVEPHPEGHRIILKPKIKDLVFIRSSKAELTELKHTRTLCRYLRFITYVPHEQLRSQMSPMERSTVNRILVIRENEMSDFIKAVTLISEKAKLIPYSETFNHIGRKIRILQGPLAGTIGTLRRIKNNKHVHIDCGGIVTVELGYVPKEMYEMV